MAYIRNGVRSWQKSLLRFTAMRKGDLRDFYLDSFRSLEAAKAHPLADRVCNTKGAVWDLTEGTWHKRCG
jgi:hypothetical protein